MNLKTYLQHKAETSTGFNVEKFRTVTALMPKPFTIGEKLKVIDFKGESVSELHVICAREDEEVQEIKYTYLVRATSDVTPDNINCETALQEKYGDKLRYIYTIAKNMTLEELIKVLKDKTIILCGQTRSPTSIRGVQVNLFVNKFAYIDE